ncbi:MAG: hypothetical protein R3B95_14180 [Nitrospirales bacterium]|nr:hypothetical protein [Nitrospirales bacterium]
MNASYLPDTTQRTAGMFPGQSYRGGDISRDDEADIRKVVRMTLEKPATTWWTRKTVRKLSACSMKRRTSNGY